MSHPFFVYIRTRNIKGVPFFEIIKLSAKSWLKCFGFAHSKKDKSGVFVSILWMSSGWFLIHKFYWCIRDVKATPSMELVSRFLVKSLIISTFYNKIEITSKERLYVTRFIQLIDCDRNRINFCSYLLPRNVCTID